MMTVVTHVAVKEGEEPAWDEAVRERIAAAREQPGFFAVQVAIPLDAPNERVIIGTWETRADWEAWHNNESFVDTRRRLERLDEANSRTWWHEVVAEAHR